MKVHRRYTNEVLMNGTHLGSSRTVEPSNPCWAHQKEKGRDKPSPFLSYFMADPRGLEPLTFRSVV